MTDRLPHKGPSTVYDLYENENLNIGLDHRRLSVLDLSNLSQKMNVLKTIVV